LNVDDVNIAIAFSVGFDALQVALPTPGPLSPTSAIPLPPARRNKPHSIATSGKNRLSFACYHLRGKVLITAVEISRFMSHED
jgi:hypothetical protein